MIVNNKNPIIILPLAVLLSACSSTDERSSERMEAYLGADYYTRLELPPDLTEPSFNKQMVIPEPSDKAKQRYQQQTSHIVEQAAADSTAPALVLPGAALMRDGETRWLSVDDDIEQVWAAIQQFLLQEGITISRMEAQIGMIETDWVAKYRLPQEAGFFGSWFNKLEPDFVDRFVFQIERSDAGSRVFVTHSARERRVQNDDISWQTIGRDIALEGEMLQRFALFAGVSGSSAELASYRAFAMRAWPSDAADNSLLVVGDLKHVTGRVKTTLDAIGLNVLEQKSDIELVIGLDNSVALTQVEEQDEIAQSSFIMQWIKSGGEADAETVHLKFIEQGALTRIDFDNSAELTSDTAWTEQLSQKMLEQLI